MLSLSSNSFTSDRPLPRSLIEILHNLCRALATASCIISVDSKRSIIQIRNKETVCLATAIVVALATHNRDKLQDIFRERLSEEVKD